MDEVASRAKGVRLKDDSSASETSPATSEATSGPAGFDDEVRTLFESLDLDADGQISSDDVINKLLEVGIALDDPRAVEMLESIRRLEKPRRTRLDLPLFKDLVRQSSALIKNAVQGKFIIPDFPRFRDEIEEMFEATLDNRKGEVATYIPQLARVNPEQFAVSVCTIDGQRISLGDTRVNFCVQSVTKPINYCLALAEHGEQHVHRHIGREPSGRGFNELTLNNDGLPHNPMINSGAIMCCSLIRQDADVADRFDHVLEVWKRLAGHQYVGFNNPVYLSERQTADRNFALGYFMREKNSFPAGSNLIDTLEFYFQCCSIELNCDALAVVAASLANGGLCPLTGDRIFSPQNVQNCLSLMLSCGMYDFSGEFAFTIGLPAKSGVSGALLVIIPQVMGIALWSPRLDALGNSVRGVEFCRRLVQRYNFHNFDGVVEGSSQKRDPRLKRHQSRVESLVNLCWAASQGDLTEVQRLAACGMDLNAADYDGRTALHLAASEGHAHIIEFLAKHGVRLDPRDRWNGTPLTDAQRGQHLAAQTLLESLGATV